MTSRMSNEILILSLLTEHTRIYTFKTTFGITVQCSWSFIHSSYTDLHVYSTSTSYYSEVLPNPIQLKKLKSRKPISTQRGQADQREGTVLV